MVAALSWSQFITLQSLIQLQTTRIIGGRTSDRKIEGQCSNYWVPHDGSCYLFSDEENPILSNRNGAQLYCKNHSANLVSIQDEAENKFVLETSQSTCENYHCPNSVWLGIDYSLKNGSKEKDWLWMDETEYYWKNWYNSEPSGDPQCARMWISYIVPFGLGSWGEKECDKEYITVCEASIGTPSTTEKVTTEVFTIAEAMNVTEEIFWRFSGRTSERSPKDGRYDEKHSEKKLRLTYIFAGIATVLLLIGTIILAALCVHRKKHKAKLGNCGVLNTRGNLTGPSERNADEYEYCMIELEHPKQQQQLPQQQQQLIYNNSCNLAAGGSYGNDPIYEFDGDLDLHGACSGDGQCYIGNKSTSVEEYRKLENQDIYENVSGTRRDDDDFIYEDAVDVRMLDEENGGERKVQRERKMSSTGFVVAENDLYG